MSVIILCVFAYTSQGVVLYAAGIYLPLNGWHENQPFSFIEMLFWIPEKTVEVANQIPLLCDNCEKYFCLNITTQLLAQKYNITNWLPDNEFRNVV